MPRDGSGNYTLPAGINPVVGGTVIADTWANPTLNDIALQLNGVVTRDGLLSMTAPFKLQDGSQALPGLNYNSEQSSGLYRASAGVLGLSILATEVSRWSAGQFSTVLGSAAAPSHSFTGDLNTGIYSPGADQVAITTGGVQRLTLTGDGRLYGSALHNNAGAVTGVTNQYIASGTYTPTITAGVNVTSPSASVCQWMRVGNVVTVSGRCFVNITTANVFTSFRLSLPIASNIAGSNECGGYGGCQSTDNINFMIEGVAATDDVICTSRPPTNGVTNIPFTFTYLIS